MRTALFGVYGASGCGRSIMPLARWQLSKAGISLTRLVFVDDFCDSASVNGQRLMRYEEFLAEGGSAGRIALAIANGFLRSRLHAKCERDRIKSWSVCAENVVKMDDVAIAEGALLSPFVTLTSNIKIGKFFHANIYSYVEHDCVIGDFVTFGPGAKCNGNVLIEDHAYIGSGAVIKQGRPGRPLVIGHGAVVGMGAVVTRDVAAGMTVVGNPARPLLSK